MPQAPSITLEMRYLLTVAGTVSERLLRSFQPRDVRFDEATTTMTVDVQDQAGLIGLIDRAGDLGLDLVGMTQVPEAPIGPEGRPVDGPRGH
jgi:hypothetical protein